VVDSFAGGGGASKGIEMAIGRSVDIAINHDPDAIRMHKVNHPNTKHYCESVWEVDPKEATGGKPVALAWFSPDCTHFSKAKGGKPKEKKIRGLAWVAVKWAKTVKPRVIMLENVQEFKTWGPLLIDGSPDPKKKGQTFELFVNTLKKLGYHVEYRELRACDYGAPTSRKRFFLIARCDGKRIVWPEPSHADPDRIEARCGLKKPWRTAREIIDWSIPCKSIFDRKKPLKENTLRRIVKGIEKFVINNPSPFIVQVNYSGNKHHYTSSMDEPLKTITEKNGWAVIAPTLMVNEFNNVGGSIDKPLHTILTGNHHYLITPYIALIGHTKFCKDRAYPIEGPLTTVVSKQEHMLITPTLIQMGYGERKGQAPRVLNLERPIGTITAKGNKFAVAAALISKYYAGNYTGAGANLEEPTPTITSKDHNALVSVFIIQQFKNSVGHEMEKPLNSITAINKSGLVKAFLMKYYGSDIGQECDKPLHTITSKDRFGLVTIKGEEYQIVDIGMRMLEPHELFAAQGFPKGYVIDRDHEGKKYSKAAQVARCGNAVPPPFAKALVEANLPELCKKEGSKEYGIL
jgi:DNA (cytosine-5)-methyltransferase 1